MQLRYEPTNTRPYLPISRRSPGGSSMVAAIFDGSRYQENGSVVTAFAPTGFVYTGHLEEDNTPVQWMFWGDDQYTTNGGYTLAKQNSEVLLMPAPDWTEQWEEWLDDTATYGEHYMAFYPPKRFYYAYGLGKRYNSSGTEVSSGTSGVIYTGQLVNEQYGYSDTTQKVQFKIYADNGMDNLVGSRRVILIPPEPWDSTGWLDVASYGQKFWAVNIGPFGAWQ